MRHVVAGCGGADVAGVRGSAGPWVLPDRHRFDDVVLPMIVGGYRLDLYCDVPGCENANCAPSGTQEPTPPGQFFAETGAQCRRVARGVGWKLDLRAGLAVCPKHCGVTIQAAVSGAADRGDQ